MYFTEGKMTEYERMMKEKPGFNKKPVPKKDRDCKHCNYYHNRRHRCKLDKCVLFDD